MATLILVQALQVIFGANLLHYENSAVNIFLLTWNIPLIMFNVVVVVGRRSTAAAHQSGDNDEHASAKMVKLVATFQVMAVVSGILLTVSVFAWKVGKRHWCNLNTAEENNFGFGQVLALVLLLAPLLSFADIFYGTDLS